MSSDEKIESTNLIKINLFDIHAESSKHTPEMEKCSISSTVSDSPVDCFIETKTRKKRNQMSFTMKRIDTQKLAQQEASIVETDKNISSFACRADVIYKKILRDFRRYFINDFHKAIGFKSSKKNKSKTSLPQMLLKYVENIFGEDFEHKKEVAFSLGALIAPQQLGTNFLGEKKSKKEVNKIHDTLYRFSITKIDNLLGDWSVGYLLKHFVADTEYTNSLIVSSKISSDSYRTAFELIGSRAETAINSREAMESTV